MIDEECSGALVLNHRLVEKYLTMKHDPDAHEPALDDSVPDRERLVVSCWGLVRLVVAEMGLAVLPVDYLEAMYADPPLGELVDPSREMLRAGDVVVLTDVSNRPSAQQMRPHAGVMIDAANFLHAGPSGVRVSRIVAYLLPGHKLSVRVWRVKRVKAKKKVGAG